MSDDSSSTASEPAWSPARRIAFRFAALYTTLWILPFPVPTWILGMTVGWTPEGLLWGALVPWFGRGVLGLDGAYVTRAASGDTAYSYTFHLLIAILAALGAALWSARTRQREHRRLYLWWTTLLRFYLAWEVLGYGLNKVLGRQFGTGALPEELFRTYGDLTPMDLLWGFMGHSWVYSGFAGVLEVVGSLLLLWRRTTPAGALILVVVLTNVVLVNFCFDVQVKLYSSHYLALALILAAPATRRLIALLFLGRPASLPIPPEPTVTPRGERIWRILRRLVIAEILLVSVANQIAPLLYFKVLSPRQAHPLTGAYEVESFVRDGREVPATFAEEKRWRTLVIRPDGRLAVRLASDHFEEFWTTPINPKTNEVIVRRAIDPLMHQAEDVGALRIVDTGGGALKIDGELDGVQLQAAAHPSARRFELVDHTIHARQGG